MLFGRSDVNASAPPIDADEAGRRVLGWQRKLHRWAGEDPGKRFGDLFNLLCDPATLLVAWEKVKRNRGSRTSGVDGDTRWRIEAAGVATVLGELSQSLKDGSYAPLPVREATIPKRGSGKSRRLGIPALRDRIVQMATKLVLEPVFEVDFCPTSYGFRPNRRAQDAIEETRQFLKAPGGYDWVIEGDVENCFGSIHQGLLMAEIRRRVTDKRVLRLIRQFLRAGVMREQDTVAATPSGTPQGAVLSPLLANVALSVLDRHFEAAWQVHGGPQRRSRHRAKGKPTFRLIRYADDFLILVAGTRAQAETIKKDTAEFMAEHMRLKLSPEKTHITCVDDGFDFLGIRVKRIPRAGRTPIALTFPSDRALTDVKHRIKELTGRANSNLSLDSLIHALNPVLRGWTNYHRHSAAKRCFGYLSYYLWWRVIRWLRKKHPHLTWKQIKRRYWGRDWTSEEGTRLCWPARVTVTRYSYRGHNIHTPWAPTERNPTGNRGIAHA
jgi:RNA-directed DNA polymerase